MSTRIAASWTAAWIGLTTLLWNGLALAQTQQSTRQTTTTQDVPTSSTTESWFAHGDWWMWAVGIAVFLIIVIALTTRSGRRA